MTAADTASKKLLKFNKRSEEVRHGKRTQMASVSTAGCVGQCLLAPWFALVFLTPLEMFGENVIS